MRRKWVSVASEEGQRRLARVVHGEASSGQDGAKSGLSEASGDPCGCNGKLRQVWPINSGRPGEAVR
jgi:hypothetical protein